jgi:hypothetical protein
VRRRAYEEKKHRKNWKIHKKDSHALAYLSFLVKKRTCLLFISPVLSLNPDIGPDGIKFTGFHAFQATGTLGSLIHQHVFVYQGIGQV